MLPGMSPNIFQQLAAGNDAALVLDEISQQGQLHLRHSYRLALDQDLEGLEVDLRAGELELLHATRLRGRAAGDMPLGKRQQVSHAADELVQVEGLAHVLVRPHVEPPRAIFGERPGAQNQHRHLLVDGPQRFADGIAAHAGQHQIEHDQIDVGGRFREQFDRRPAVPADGDAVTLGDEIVLDSHREVFFVLDDQNVLFVRHERQFSRFTMVLYPLGML